MPGRASAPWLLLAAAMAAAAALILWAGRGTGFTGDALAYYGRLVERAGEFSSADSLSVEYLLTPHNGHLQLAGKLIYEGMFALFGTAHLGFRVVALLGLLACAGLVFELARRRVGGALALVGTVALLFCGAAWEVMIWPFNLHTLYALAFGLGALLALEHRPARFADPLACALLVAAVATIEVGLAAVVAVAVLVLARPDRLRRAWVFAVPLALYAAWWVWARQFEHGGATLSRLADVPVSLGESAAATLGSLVGRIDAGAEAFPQTVGINAWGVGLAVLAALALALRVRRGGGSPWLWALLAALVTYWGSTALAEVQVDSGLALDERPPDSSRYIFVGAALVILVAAEALRGVRISKLAVIGACLVVAVALPENLTKLFDGREFKVNESELNRAHFAALELARDGSAGSGPAAAELARTGFDFPYVLAPATYFDAAERFGSIAFTLDELRGAGEPARAVADRTLAGVFELALEPAEPPPDPGGCRRLEGESGAVAFDLAPGGALLRAGSGRPVALGIGRFATAPPSVQLGELSAGRWSRLAIAPDGAPEPWRAYATGAVRACEL